MTHPKSMVPTPSVVELSIDDGIVMYSSRAYLLGFILRCLQL